MGKIYTALGLMSGTSMDGVDASVIKSDGKNNYKVIANSYFKYNYDFFKKITTLRSKINQPRDLINLVDELKSIEREITLFHAQISNEIIEKAELEIDFIGFHGQTIFHDVEAKITKQLGDGNLLSQLTKKSVVYNFRQNDLKNGGEGAPLTPIYHKLVVELLEKENKLKVPIIILNIGGIANITSINKTHNITSSDIGPGNCLIDKWIRTNSDKNFDEGGNIAKLGKIDKIILEQTLDSFYNNTISKRNSFDTKDFDIYFARGLSLEDGAATITEFTADILSKKLINDDIYVCGGGRKNDFLINSIQKKIQNKIKRIDNLDIDGGFIESQAFAYLAIRSYLSLPISFPATTGCKSPTCGGVLVKNF